jgi:hypothetical protein
MKVEAGQEDNGTAASASAGETALAEMNAAFASCLSLVCPPIQYPPHCRFSPVRDAADTAEIELRLEEFFLHAKQLEQLFLDDTADSLSSLGIEAATTDTAAERAGAGDPQPGGRAGREERPDRQVHGRGARLGGQVQAAGPPNVPRQGVRRQGC